MSRLRRYLLYCNCGTSLCLLDGILHRLHLHVDYVCDRHDAQIMAGT